jgi:hypothetical protein
VTNGGGGVATDTAVRAAASRAQVMTLGNRLDRPTMSPAMRATVMRALGAG